MTQGVGFIPKIEQPLPKQAEKHTANSQWQFCNCGSCQRIRLNLEALPGRNIDYATYRHKDEKY